MDATEIQLHSLNLFDENMFGFKTNYINCLRLFYVYYKTVPSIKCIDNIDSERLIKWIETEMKESIVKKHSRQRYDRKKRITKNVDTIYLLSNQLVIDVDGEDVYIVFSELQESFAERLLNEVKRFSKREKKNREIWLVTKSSGELSTTALNIKKPRLDIAKLYNDDLLIMHKTIVKNLKQKDKSGLFLLHGLPGTGKSTYIRFLINSINKKVIFMPPGFAGNLDEPAIANFLIENANTVFVIEDAEELMISRDSNKNSSISMLLNLTDGLLGESLGIQVIATFNTNITKIDKALLRKSRLKALYEFKPLSVAKSNLLLEEIGIKNFTVTQPMTLAEIFNTEEEAFHLNNNQRQPIGFLSQAV
jgi:hypothetical protein